MSSTKFFDEEEKEAFLKSDEDQWHKHMAHKAVTVIPPELAAKVP